MESCRWRLYNWSAAWKSHHSLNQNVNGEKKNKNCKDEIMFVCCVSQIIITIIMTLKLPKKFKIIWKENVEETIIKIWGVKVLNLIREFAIKDEWVWGN